MSDEFPRHMHFGLPKSLKVRVKLSNGRRPLALAGVPQAKQSTGLITELDPTVETAAQDCKAENTKNMAEAKKPMENFQGPTFSTEFQIVLPLY